jgi:hypothetical protein
VLPAEALKALKALKALNCAHPSAPSALSAFSAFSALAGQYTSYHARSMAVVGVALPLSAFNSVHLENSMTALPITTF